MPQQTVGRMAKLYGMHRSSLYEAIAAGRVTARLNARGQKVIDLSEMIRVYGEPDSNPTAPDSASPAVPDSQPDSMGELIRELRALRQEVSELRQQLALPPPAPTQEQEIQSTTSGGLEQEKQEDDPHGLRALMRDTFNK